MHPAIAELGHDAQLMGRETTDLNAQRSIRQALMCVNSAHDAHEAGDPVGASAHLGKAARYLNDAAKAHTGKLKRGDLDSSPVMLDHADLGKGHQLHQDYLDDINKGKNDGR